MNNGELKLRYVYLIAKECFLLTAIKDLIFLLKRQQKYNLRVYRIKEHDVILSYIKVKSGDLRIKPMRIVKVTKDYFYADSVDGRKRYSLRRVLAIMADSKRNSFKRTPAFQKGTYKLRFEFKNNGSFVDLSYKIIAK